MTGRYLKARTRRTPAPTPTTMLVNAKCSDLCQVVVFDEHGQPLADHIGYVPDGLGITQDFGGDFVELTIELATGKVVGWKPPTATVLRKFIANTKRADR